MRRPDFAALVSGEPPRKLGHNTTKSNSESDPIRTPRDVRLGSEMRSRSCTKPPSHSKRASCTTTFSKTCLPRHCRRRDKAELLQHHQSVKHQIERGMLTVAKVEHVDSLPLAAQAQQPMPVIGYLGGGFLSTVQGTGGQHAVDAFESGLREMGFVVGQNLAIEYRWAENRPERLPGLVADLVRRRVSVGAMLHSLTATALMS
jgi:hypothetical protein